MVTPVELMIIYSDRRNLQKDKHHCNTPSIWALWECGKTQSSPQWRQQKTLLKYTKEAPKGPSDSERQDSLIWWTSMLSIMFEGNQICSSPAEYHPKSKVCWQQHRAGGMFFSGRDWGTRQNRRKAQCTKLVRLALMKTQSRAFRTSDWAGGLAIQQDNDPKHTARVAYTQLCECLWVAQPEPEPELEPIKYFWRNLKMCVCPIHPDRAWELKRWGEE